VSDPVPLVSFTFGIPGRNVTGALQTAGTVVVQTVTSRQEAELAAAAAGVDMIAVQASAAGGHSATLTPDRAPKSVSIVDLVTQITGSVQLPVVAAGGISTPDDVAGVTHAGAEAAIVGTVLMRADESGTSATHQAALADPSRTETVITRAFTGRPARGLADISASIASGVLYPAARKPNPPAWAAATTIAGVVGPPDIGAAITGITRPKFDSGDVIVACFRCLAAGVPG
jgi:nitronate monooxygenase